MKPRPGLLALVLLLAGASADAQAPQGPAQRGFSQTIRVDEAWESDPIFEAQGEPSSFVTRAGAGLAYQGGGRRSTLSVGGDGGGVFYHDLPGFNSYYFGGNLGWVYRISPRTTFTFTESLTNDYARRSPLLVGNGIVLPLVRALTSRTDAGLSHDLSPRTRLETYASYDYVKFLSGDLFDGRQFGTGLSLSRRFQNRSSLGVAYGFSRSTSQIQDAQDYHSARLVWSMPVGRSTTVAASAGATALRRLDRSWTYLPTGSASISMVEPRSSLVTSLRYAHEVSQAFGLGFERVADVVTFSLSRPFGRKLSANLGYSYSLSRETGADAAADFSYGAHSGNGGLRFTATRTLSLDLGYTYFRSAYYTPPINNHVLMLGLLFRRGPH